MDIRLNKEEILSGIQKAAGIIPQKTGAAYLRTIWLEAESDRLKVMSTDSKLEFSGSYPATVQTDGLIGVQGRSFFELFRKLPPGEISLVADPENETLLLKQGRRKYKLPTYDAQWFQRFSAFPEDKAVVWSGAFLKGLIERISFCIADDDTDNMNFMKIAPRQEPGHIETCGLNGHQFAMQRFENQDIYDLLGENGILVAKPYLQELKKWLTGEELFFTVDEKRLFFTNKDKNEHFSLPIHFDVFPKYQVFLSYFEEETSQMSVDKAELLDSLERISIFNTETQRCTYFVFDNGELVLYSQGQDVGEATESLSVEYHGQLDKIAFPTRNLIEIMTHFKSDQLRFEFTHADGPCKITGNDDGEYMVIIMPIKIQEETYYEVEETDSID